MEDTCRFAEICSGFSCDYAEDYPGVYVDDVATIPYCEAIPTGVVTTEKGATVESLELEEGYYRVSNTSHDIMECYREAACTGGDDAGDYCATGYTGPCKS